MAASPKDKHLQKTPPPALRSRQDDASAWATLQQPIPTSNDFKNANQPIKPASSGGNKILIALVSALLLVVIFLVLVVFVPPVRAGVRPYLPVGMQELLQDSPNQQPGNPSNNE